VLLHPFLKAETVLFAQILVRIALQGGSKKREKRPVSSQEKKNKKDRGSLVTERKIDRKLEKLLLR
jgi:hypothetical protein